MGIANHSIYAILKPGKPRSQAVYVGRTIKLKGRLNSHRRRFGPDIQMHVLETDLTDYEASLAEPFWIEKLIGAGFPLENRIKARAGSLHAGDEMRKKSSETHKARWQNDPKHRRKMRKALSAPSRNEKIRAAMKLRWQDPEYRKEMSEAGKRQAANPGLMARTQSAASRHKRSLTQKKKFADEKYHAERVAKMHSPEANKRKSESKKAYLAIPENYEKHVAIANRPDVRRKKSLARKAAWKRLGR